MQNAPYAPGTVIAQGHGIPEDNRKNIDGSLGPRCRDCSGLGFTTKIAGGSPSCVRCFGTGIEPPNIYDMAKTIEDLTRRIKKLEKKKK